MSWPMRFMVAMGVKGDEGSEARYSGVMPPWTNEAAARRNGFLCTDDDDDDVVDEEKVGSPRKRRSDEPRGVEGRTGAARLCGKWSTR